ncbi:hypothetical protein L484_004720 [Morus notabilis]|uniref:Uncharacterized protein n=1 Tax=Morus notabilis TaxID=981085 RepID=W9RTQ3_9ROSA|nr:hypothetical protein L484_004720 [Morus notabilis]
MLRCSDDGREVYVSSVRKNGSSATSVRILNCRLLSLQWMKTMGKDNDEKPGQGLLVYTRKKKRYITFASFARELPRVVVYHCATALFSPAKRASLARAFYARITIVELVKNALHFEEIVSGTTSGSYSYRCESGGFAEQART